MRRQAILPVPHFGREQHRRREDMTSDKSSIQIPTDRELLGYVRDALLKLGERESWHDVARCNPVASEIAQRFSQISEFGCISCYGGASGRAERCNGPEWLFDFSALLYRHDKPHGTDRFVLQPLIVGEIERDTNEGATDHDFEKLLVADSILCFFVFRAKSAQVAERRLSKYENAIRERKEYAKVRGCQPPVFLLACYVAPLEDIAIAGPPVLRIV